MTPGRFPRALVSAAVATALACAAWSRPRTAPAAADPAESLYLCDLGGIFGEFEVPFDRRRARPSRASSGGCPRPGRRVGRRGLLRCSPTCWSPSLIGLTRERHCRRPTSSTCCSPGRRSPVGLASGPGGVAGRPSRSTCRCRGSNREFVPGDVGELALSLPDDYDLDLDQRPAYRCSRRTASSTTTRPAEIGTVDVVKQTPSMTGKVLKRPVRRPPRTQGAGQRVEPARQGCARRRRGHLAGETIGSGILENGAARLRLARLPVGKHA